jgi:hypothetical protein
MLVFPVGVLFVVAVPEDNVSFPFDLCLPKLSLLTCIDTAWVMCTFDAVVIALPLMSLLDCLLSTDH